MARQVASPVRVQKIQTYKLRRLGSKSSEEKGNSDGTGSGGELSSACPGDFGLFTIGVVEVVPDSGLRVDFVVDLILFILEFVGEKWAIKVGF